MSTTRAIFLEPLDVLFFRDGRPFGAAGRGASGLPTPQTAAGALRTALLQKWDCNFRLLPGDGGFADAVRRSCDDANHWIGATAFRGPWFARRGRGAADPAAAEVLVRAPATLRTRKKQADGRLYTLRPLRGSLPGWPGESNGLRPLWLRQRVATEPIDAYLTPAGLRAFLEGREVASGDVVERGQLFDFDHRTGIGIDPDRLSAQESLIYGASFLALKEGVGLYLEVVLPESAPADALDGLDVLPLGGEARRVGVRLAQPFDWPQPSLGPGQRTLLLLTTPGLFADRWQPSAVRTLLAAAAVPGSLAVSGWDLARGGPKPTRFAVPAGSVYFLDGAAGALPADSLCDAPDDGLQGWGCYLKGTWTDV
jgi:CRISPR-associated protein Cmr3